jgi:hypothetical protein
MLSFGYWMLSSNQICSNDVNYRTHSSSPPVTKHIWTEVFTSAGYTQNPGAPLLILFWIFLIATFLRTFVDKLLMKIFTLRSFEIDEDLENYFNTIDENDRNWSIAEEEYSRKTMNIKILPDETLEKFKTTKMKDGNQMKGVHCYDILANPLYLDDFQYFSPSQDDRATFIIDDDEDEDNDMAQSDLVKIILNLAFLTSKQAKEFTFSKSSAKVTLGNLAKIN